MPGEDSCEGVRCVSLAWASPQVDHFLISNIDAQLSILLPTCAAKHRVNILLGNLCVIFIDYFYDAHQTYSKFC